MSGELDEAIGRARDHARRALLETLATVQALLDVLLRTQSIDPSSREASGPSIQDTLSSWHETLRNGGDFDLPKNVVEPLLEALDREIARWERRSRSDPEARTVLRAFLGLREVLWEFVATPGESADMSTAPPTPTPTPTQTPTAPPTPTPAPPRPKAASRPRVRRFDVEG